MNVVRGMVSFLPCDQLPVTIVCGIRTKDATIARTGRQPLRTVWAVPAHHSYASRNGCSTRMVTVGTGDVGIHGAFSTPPQRQKCRCGGTTD